MNKKTELVYAIKALFDACNPHDIDPEEIPQRLETMNNLKELDFEDLLQALRFNAETVYAYSAEGCDCGTGCTYYGQELFPRRAIVLAPTVIELFKAQRAKQALMMMDAGKNWESHNLIFTNPTGGYLSYRTVYDCFKRVVKKLGLPNTRFHDLRHTYAVAAIKSGDDIKTVQENLGHATAAFTLDVYGHVTDQMKHVSANRMEAFISSVSC